MSKLPPLVSAATLTTLLLLQALPTAGQPAAPGRTGKEPALEKRVLLGPESAGQWSAAESDLETSLRRTRTGQAVLHWRIKVDHFGGEAKYPVGWPRVSCALLEAALRDWSGWDYLQFCVYPETSRESLPRSPVGLALHTPDKQNSFSRALDEVRKDTWTQIRIPLSQVTGHHEVRLLQFHIADSNYRHGDELDWYIDEITLLRYAQPTLLEFTAENGVMFADARHLAVRFKLAGVMPEREELVAVRLRQEGQVLLETRLKARRGPQRATLDLTGARLAAGDYEVTARIEGGTQETTAPIRLVTSPWSEDNSRP